MRNELQRVRDWANERIKSGQEPPWAWFQYMKLRENIDQILVAMDSVTSSPQPAPHSGGHLRLVDEAGPQDSAPPRRPGTPVSLPM